MDGGFSLFVEGLLDVILPNLDFAWISELNQQLYFGKNLIYNKWKVERGGLHVRITEADISMQKAIS